MKDDKPTYEELAKRVQYLEKELARYQHLELINIDTSNNIEFDKLFDLTEIQRIQDLFAEATGVASIITDPNGVPITLPSNFCQLCSIIRKTEKGLKNCFHSDAIIGKQNVGGAIYQPCLSGGLWDGGASISVGGKHIANWLIGQVKNRDIDESKMLDYAREIGADQKEFKKALSEVRIMPSEQFKKIADTLFFFANELSQKAYQNIQQNKLISELQLKEQQLIKAKEEIEISEQKFRLMLKNSSDTFVLINEKGEQFYVSDAATRDTGFTVEELLGPIQNVIYPDDFELVAKAWGDILTKKDEVIRLQYRHKHKTKDYIWYEAVGQNYLDNPVIKAVVVNIRDITEIKAKEQELTKAKEKAEENDRLKTAFLQNMSHEIRTPMNAIMGFSDLLIYHTDDKEKLKSFSEIINQRCIDLLEIINDILDISKIESGQLTLNIENCNIGELLTELDLFFKEHQKRIGKEQIQFKLQHPNNKQITTIQTDKVKLKQILINLIGNAFKFTETGSIECGCKIKHHQLIFFISDTGIGIPPEKHEMIFERFSQLNHDSAKNTGGTGLGLSIAKGLANLLGGQIWLESLPNKGTTFYFSINYDITTK